MKNILYICALFITTMSFAQQIGEIIIPLEDKRGTDEQTGFYYFKDVNNILDKFMGTWKYETPTETLQITFYKVEHEEYGKDYTDYIRSNFVYVKNGVTIFDTNTVNPEDNYFVVGSIVDTQTQLDLLYSEPTSLEEWTGRLILNYIPASNGEPEKLNWFVKTFAKKTVNGQKVYPYEIPYELVLEKQ